MKKNTQESIHEVDRSISIDIGNIKIPFLDIELGGTSINLVDKQRVEKKNCDEDLERRTLELLQQECTVRDAEFTDVKKENKKKDGDSSGQQGNSR